MSDVTNTATLEQPMTMEERDEALMRAIENDDDEQFSELMGSEDEGEVLEKADPVPAPVESGVVATSPKSRKAAKEAALAAKEAERAALQARVPWELVEEDRNSYRQKPTIDQWADDWGHFPRCYRSYTREEWAQAIALLAQTVSQLAETHPDYQRTTGLYVEEYSADTLLIRSKAWQLLIQVPSKSSVKGKLFKLEAAAGKDSWGGSDTRADAFAEFLTVYVADEHRDILLDICCQYLRDVRIRVNRATWGILNPDLAYLLNDNR